MRAFLDANVLVSASLGSASVALRLWEAAETGRITLVTSHVAIAQAARNLSSKSPDDVETLGQLLAQVEVSRLMVDPDQSLPLDYEDGVLLATGIACGATHFITGDKHFRPLMGRDDLVIRVITLREFLRLVQGEDGDAS